MRVWFGLATVALILICKKPLHAEEICCAPDQFEGTAFVGYGNVFIDRKAGASQKSPRTAYSYINGTVALSYDYTNRRLLLKLAGTEVSPLLPKPEPYNTIYLSDFGKGIMYQVGADGSCQKSSLEQNMTRQCILSGGTEVVHGFLAGANTNVANYMFDVEGSIPLKITASVIRDGNDCWPVRANFIPEAGIASRDGQSGIMYNFDLLDTSRGIRNPSIFKPPPQCNGIPFTKKYTHKIDPFRFILHQFGLH
ncbi:uncharacterized protein LOC110464507 [Mizuhopecten yessoensis]|uniref:Ependymin-related protein 1 n=1 Tax=Mizuhopecten yessoensis TaxID=6573 RepID=A0A210PTP4_MIZYE|nr:uncharacterized protein LOC110464507 [Mizuhopecten yessoensis]OWF39880.1 hypothetical protein KP79_PYT06143 [Mizuhopecten yessoensis]